MWLYERKISRRCDAKRSDGVINFTTFKHRRFMMQVYVADLLKLILQQDEHGLVKWLCKVRDLDCHNAKSSKISKACDAVIQTLIRFFTARYMSRSINIIETFRDLLVTCSDSSIDCFNRWQRICNICAFLMVNAHKPNTIHVFPGLISPLLELDEKDPQQCQSRISARNATALQVYVLGLMDVIPRQTPSGTALWLDTDPPNPPQFKSHLLLLESALIARKAKEAQRIITHIILAAYDLRTNRHEHVFACIWNVVIIALNSSDVPVPVKRYVECCESAFFCMLPPSKSARCSRLAFLYYATLVMCTHKLRTHSSVCNNVVNLPVTIPPELQYLSIFPRLGS